MRVLHLIAPVSFGGGESLLYNLLKNSPIREGIALLYDSKKFREKLTSGNIKYYILNKKEIGYFQSRLKYLIDFFLNIFLIKKICKILDRDNYTHLHAHGFPAVIFGYVVKLKRPEVKIIYTHHSYRKRPTFFLEYFIFKYIYSKYDQLTAVSYTVRDSLIASFNLNKNIEVIYNCISDKFYNDNKKYNENIIKHFRKKDKIKFVQISRLTKIKNHTLVIKSLLLLDQSFLNKIHIYFIGDGPELKNIIDLIYKYDLVSYISCLGAVDYDEIPQVLELCDYALFPSESEGFGLAVVECMAKGLPVLALENNIMREIVKDNGILVKKEELHKGFIEIVNKKFDRNKIAKYATGFSSKIIKQQYIELYQRLG